MKDESKALRNMTDEAICDMLWPDGMWVIWTDQELDEHLALVAAGKE